MDKEQYLLDLVSKGYTDEDITILLAAKYPEEHPLPAPAATSTNTPQQILDRTVVAIKKVNTNLSTEVSNRTAADATTLQSAKDYTNTTKTTITTEYTAADTTLYNGITTEQDAKIKYYSGQIISFTEVKTGTNFENAQLFDKHLIPAGAALVGGTGGAVALGRVRSHQHTIGRKAFDKVYNGDSVSAVSYDWALYTDGSYDLPSTGTAYDDPEHKVGHIFWGRHGLKANGSVEYDAPALELGDTQLYGNATNDAYGVQLLAVVYVAKKNITFADMGE